VKAIRFLFSIFRPLLLAAAWLPGLRADDVLTVADRLVHQHLTYVYGSEDIRKGGLDCSGFIQIVFRDAYGVDMPNEADKQLAYLRVHGRVWDSTSGWTKDTLQPGDLIFYAGPYPLPRASLVSHVMMYCGNGIMAGSQGEGRRLDGGYSGVGYYHFRPHSPSGILDESGERFLNHRKIFAYGRLSAAPDHAPPESIVSIPTPVAPGFTGSAAASTGGFGFDLKPVGINPRFD
jgi:hypothetical protein